MCKWMSGGDVQFEIGRLRHPISSQKMENESLDPPSAEAQTPVARGGSRAKAPPLDARPVAGLFSQESH